MNCKFYFVETLNVKVKANEGDRPVQEYKISH